MVTQSLALMFLSVSSTLDLPPGLLSALCWIESNHRPTAINQFDGDSPSYGACQIKLETARMLGFKGTPEQLMLPKNNIFWAGKYLKKQLTRYDEDPRKAVAAYNAGSHKVNKRGNTRNVKYVNKVFKAWAEYR